MSKSIRIFKTFEEQEMYFLEYFVIPYEFLRTVKLLSSREKDLWDIARLEGLKNKKQL